MSTNTKSKKYPAPVYAAAAAGDLAYQKLRKLPGVAEVYPKLRFRFPSMAYGGKQLLGQEVGTHEMIGDGIEPALLKPVYLRPPAIGPQTPG